MSRFGLMWLSLAVVSFNQVAGVVAQETRSTIPAVSSLELVDAYHEYALARQNLVWYRQVILPQQRQTATDAIQQTTAEAQVLRRRLRDYQPFLAVGRHSPVRTAAENAHLNLLATEQSRRHWQDEETALMRFSGEVDKLYRYEVLRAALRVQAARAAILPE